MRKLIVFLETGYAGMDSVEALVMTNDTTEEELHYIIWDMAMRNAEMYGVEYGEDPEEDDGVEYSQDIQGYYEEYDAEKHDMYRSGGGSFEEDFAEQEKYFD